MNTFIEDKNKKINFHILFSFIYRSEKMNQFARLMAPPLRGWTTRILTKMSEELFHLTAEVNYNVFNARFHK